MCPAVKTASFIREGLNVQEGPYCYGLPAWGYLVVGCSGTMVWELSLAPKLFLCYYWPLCFPVSLEICIKTLNRCPQKKSSKKEAIT